MKVKSFKAIISVVLMLCSLSFMCTTALAADEERVDATRYTGISSCFASLTISNWGKCSCCSFADCNSGYSASLTMELKRGSTTIKTWTTSGSGMVTLDKTYYVVSGYTYQVVATIEVKDSHGVVVDTIEKSSYSVTF